MLTLYVLSADSLSETRNICGRNQEVIHLLLYIQGATKSYYQKIRRKQVNNMRHGKRPTVRQKKFLTSHNLNCDNWLVVRDDKGIMIIKHRQTGTVREIKKEQ